MIKIPVQRPTPGGALRRFSEGPYLSFMKAALEARLTG